MVYLHNPRCSKSREGLKLLQDQKIDFEVREYLKNPLSQGEIKDLCFKLSKHPQDILRKKEIIYKDLGLSEKNWTPNEWHQIIEKHPTLLERPILITEKKARIGRPPERLLEILS